MEYDPIPYPLQIERPDWRQSIEAERNLAIQAEMQRFLFEAMRFDDTFLALPRLNVSLDSDRPMCEELEKLGYLNTYMELTDPEMLKADQSYSLDQSESLIGSYHGHLLEGVRERAILPRHAANSTLTRMMMMLSRLANGNGPNLRWWKQALPLWKAYKERLITVLGAPETRVEEKLYNLLHTRPWYFWMQFWEWSIQVLPHPQSVSEPIAMHMREALYGRMPHLNTLDETRVVVERIQQDVLGLLGDQVSSSIRKANTGAAESVLAAQIGIMRDACPEQGDVLFIVDPYTRRLFAELGTKIELSNVALF